MISLTDLFYQVHFSYLLIVLYKLMLSLENFSPVSRKKLYTFYSTIFLQIFITQMTQEAKGNRYH